MDYTYPSIFFSYFFFALCVAGAAFFFVRSFRDGYWSKDGEEIKYVMFEEESGAGAPQGGKNGAQ
jgi:hypothetical protein